MSASSEWRLAPDSEIARRPAAVEALVTVLEPDPECRPWFLSDEATVFEVLLEPEAEVRSRLFGAFGPAVAEVRLSQPLWRLVDELAVLVPDWPAGAAPGAAPDPARM